MAATNDRTVTVFGGTGFLGRRVVRHLRKDGFSVRIASRHPDRSHRLFGLDDPQLQSVRANVHDERSVADALIGAYGVLNAVSLDVERKRETFHSVHVASAQRVAAQAHRGRVRRIVHVSGIGADAASQSLHIRMRGEGERAVRANITAGRMRSESANADHPQPPPSASILSDVRPWSDENAAGLCGRCGGEPKRMRRPVRNASSGLI